MKFHLIILILVILSFFCCKKDKNVYPGGGYSSPEYVFICDTLPQDPVTGWIDTTANKDKDVQKILYNPLTSNEVIYVVKSKNYYSEMYLFNKQTKIAKSIDKSIYTMPSINKYGWLTYCKANYQVYKIKFNGDSLTQLTTISGNFPRWDYTGDNILYTQNGFGSSPHKVIKMNKFGVKLDSLIYQALLGASTKSNKILGWNTSNQLFLKDLDTGIETILKTGDYNYICSFDNNDENIYWNGNKGIFKLNLNTLKEDTLVKMCKLLSITSTPSFELFTTNISPNSNKLTFCTRTNDAANWPKLFHEYKALEMDLYNNRITEIKLFH